MEAAGPIDDGTHDNGTKAQSQRFDGASINPTMQVEFFLAVQRL